MSSRANLKIIIKKNIRSYLNEVCNLTGIRRSNVAYTVCCRDTKTEKDNEEAVT